jgi:hypothetical protein
MADTNYCIKLVTAQYDAARTGRQGGRVEGSRLLELSCLAYNVRVAVVQGDSI